MSTNSVSISKIKRSIFDLRVEIAHIKGEQPSQDKKFDIYMWKGIKISGHTSKPITSISLIISDDYVPIPDSKYLLLLLRDDLLREKQILTRELINKITNYYEKTGHTDI